MQDQLRLILEVEAEARQQLDAAREECTRRIWEAEGHGRQRIREAQNMRDAIVRAVEEQLAAEARAEAQRIADHMQAKGAAMRALAESRMDRAVDATMQLVLGQDTRDGR